LSFVLTFMAITVVMSMSFPRLPGFPPGMVNTVAKSGSGFCDAFTYDP
jgi:hypothetical protein